MPIQFEHPWVLLLLVVIPVLCVWWLFLTLKQERHLQRFSAHAHQYMQRQQNERRNRYLQMVLIVLAACLLVIAGAGPRWGQREERTARVSRDLVIAVDVSLSMLADDVRPSRLERAKADLLDLVRELEGYRVAVIAFRQGARIICPLTSDYRFVKQAVSGLTPGSAPRGETHIGSGIRSALEVFQRHEASHRTLLLVTDGEDLAGDVDQAVREAVSQNVRILTVGYGHREGSTIPDPDNPGNVLHHQGEPIITRLEHETLLDMARRTGGAYIPVETAGTGSASLGDIYKDYLRDTPSGRTSELLETRAAERFAWFVFPAWILIFIATWLSHGQRLAAKSATTAAHMEDSKTMGKRLFMSGLMVFMGIVPGMLQADEAVNDNGSSTDVTLHGRAAARAAQRFYRQGAYEQAADLYAQARTGQGDAFDASILHNEAVSLYAAGRYREAAERFRDLMALQHPAFTDAMRSQAMSLYQKAMHQTADTLEEAHARVETLRRAAKVYQQALRLDDNASLRHDFALTLEALKQAEQQAQWQHWLTEHGDTPLPTLARNLLTQQREIVEEAQASSSLPPPEKIAAWEELARNQKANAALAAGLEHHLANNASMVEPGADTRQAVVASLREAQAQMRDAGQQLQDIDPDGRGSAQEAERTFYELWKNVALLEDLLDEAVHQQTRTLEQTSEQVPPEKLPPLEQQQRENARLTDQFRQQLEQALAESHLENGMEDLAPETKEAIQQAAQEAVRLQTEAADQLGQREAEQAIPLQQQALEHLLDIVERLKPPPPPPDTSPEEAPEAPQDSDTPEAPQQPPDATESHDDEMMDATVSDEDPDEEDVQTLLQRALEREQEYLDRQRRRQDRRALPPDVRDW